LVFVDLAEPSATGDINMHVVFMMLPLINGVNREGHRRILSYVEGPVDSGHLHPLLDDEEFTLETATQAVRRL
jgi:NADPH2:quinone reductase